MPAESEEVVVHTDGFQPEDAGERLTQQLFPKSRRAASAGGRHGGEVGGRQSPSIQLPVGRQRQRVERQHHRRHHVLRQGRRGVLAQSLDLPDHVGDEHLAAYHDRRVRDARVGLQHRLDLNGLDPVAAHLDLVVHAAEEVQTAVGAASDPVPGAVQPRARRSERVRHEPFGGQRWPAVVAVRHAGATDDQLADGADRSRTAVGVQNVRGGVGDRTADQHLRRIRRDSPRHRPDRGLGRAVHVHQPAGPRPQLAGEAERKRFPAGQRRDVRQPNTGVEQHAPSGRRRLDVGHTSRFGEAGQRRTVPGGVPIGQHQAGTGHQRQVDLKPRDVERQRRRGQPHVAGTGLEQG